LLALRPDGLRAWFDSRYPLQLSPRLVQPHFRTKGLRTRFPLLALRPDGLRARFDSRYGVFAVIDPLALYVHWPFCVSKCPYCDFNSHVRAEVDQVAWREALLADLAHEADLLPGRRIGSIFFGGGTPSLMPPETVRAVIETAEARWGLAEDVEITLEANPSSVEAARFVDLASAGVNRVSLGLQALDDAALRFLGRAHDMTEGLGALETAQRAFARVSFDLIYARPGQSLGAWDAELARALAFGTEHLSLYQLTIEPGTRFATLAAQGALALPDPDDAADLFEATRVRTAAAGLPAYEISNHARAGAESRHNLTYWRYGDYAGIGPGAHGRRSGLATFRRKKPENWLAAVARNAHGVEREDSLTPAERAVEALLMGLRLREGVDLARIAALAQGESPLDPRALARIEAQGLVVREESRLRVTDAGMPVLEAILREVVTP
jgi:putative oxygen-independent coproporphyrinogen III oxidase